MTEVSFQHKIKTPEEIAELIGPRPREQKAILCHGTFDVVHPGHIRHLLYAKEHADILIASLTCDVHVQKTSISPYVPEHLRAMSLAAFEMVDHVIIDPNPEPLEVLETIKPDLFAKGYEYTDGALSPKTAAEKAVLDGYGGEFMFTPGDVVYSSTKLIHASPPNLSLEKLELLMQSEGIDFDRLRSALDKLRDASVHVVGDTIVDTYTETALIGGQTKTPTLSVRLESETQFVGGAGIVSKHLSAAGARVNFTTLLGDDSLKDMVLQDLAAAGVEVQPIISKSRPTTNKNAIVCDGYRLLKVDSVDNRAVSGDALAKLQDLVSGTKSDAVVFSDFRHGIFNHSTIPQLIGSIPENVFRVADSQVASRWGNICEFSDFDLITPNEREARFALGDQDSVIRPLAQKLFETAQCQNLILKMGERGLIAYRRGHDIGRDHRAYFVVDSFVDDLRDAVGAGDALLAYATLAHVTDGNPVVAAVLGALAAAAECELDGNIPVAPDAIYERIDKVERRSRYQP
ncbi:MAG: ADP-heptose synthase [Alphaproteobacteria bacterium]|nr:ADP-heptose synthase [Alphaproteobacteria bacterium]